MPAARSDAPDRHAPHALGLVAPLATLAGLVAGGVWVAAGVVLPLGLYPLLDLALGERAPRRRAAQAGGACVSVLPWLHGLLHLAVLAALLARVAADGFGPTALVACAAAGINGGASALITAHELGHRPPRSAGWRLARLLLFCVHYSHFTTEHNRGHHRLVATAADPASAAAGESLWRFVARTVPGQLASALRLEAVRGPGGPVRPGRLGGPVRRGLLLQAAALLLLGLGPALFGSTTGWLLAGAWLLHAAFSVLLLEYVNYLQHWGLRRADGERQAARHSWQSTARWSRWTLLELPLHPDHHLHAARPYWALEAHPDAPRLPAGYYACFWPALLPPLWRRWVGARQRSTTADAG